MPPFTRCTARYWDWEDVGSGHHTLASDHFYLSVLRQLSGVWDQNLPGVTVCASSLVGEDFQASGSKICVLWGPAAPQGLRWGQETAPISRHSFWRPTLLEELVRKQIPKASQTLTKGNASSEKHLFRLKFNSLISTIKKQMNTHCTTQPQIRFLRTLQLWLCLH